MKYYAIAIIACLILSCNQTFPTEDMAFKKFISKQGDKNNAMFEFSDFKKINGSKQTILGKEVYTMDYHVKQIAKQDLHECTAIGKTYFLTDSAIVEDSIKQSQFKTGHIDRPTYVKAYKKGELVKEFDGKINFTNKDDGWQ